MKKVNIVAMFMSILMVFTSIFSVGAVTNNNVKKEYTVKEKGVIYTITVNSKANIKDVVVKTNKTKDYERLLIDLKNNKIDKIDYRHNGVKQYSTKQTYNLNDIEKSQSINQFNKKSKIKYNSITKTKWTFLQEYWYAYGSQGKKTYLKIGCKAKYEIRTDNLPSKKESNCTKYTNSIKKCNSSYNKAKATVFSSKLFVAISALVVANIAFPPSVIVTIVCAVLGAAGFVATTIYHLIDSYDYYSDAKDIYTIIRTYGKKL